MFDQALLLVSQTILTAVPFVLAALGGTCSERAGVVNIALEGILLFSAFAAAVASFATGDPWIGLMAGAMAGVVVAVLHALLTVTFKVDQIISGLAINIFAAGATSFGSHLVWQGTASRSVPLLPRWQPATGDAIGDLVNTILGMPLVLLTLFAVPAVWAIIEHSRFGLRLRAVGENPAACDTLGISVFRMRYAAVMLSGLLAGLGGVWLAYNIGQFQHGMSAGKGFIAMAAVVTGKWRPVHAAAACLLFGFSGTLAAACERWGLQLPSELISTLPYVLTVVLVAGLVGRARAPAALGTPYG